MKIEAIKTSVFEEGQDLAGFVIKHIKKLEDGDVLAVTSKIAALAESRTDADTSDEHKQQLIKSESQAALEAKYVWLTIKDGVVMASAGIDQSNAKGKLVLLPLDSYKTASDLRGQLMKHFGISKLGVVLTDSRVMPLRAGTVGMSVGYSGFKGIRDYVGKPDIFGRKFVFETMNIPDALAAAAVLVMGEGAEQQPLAVISGAEVEFTDKIDPKELLIEPANDLYREVLDLTKLNNSGSSN